jgi:hypothetical protein
MRQKVKRTCQKVKTYFLPVQSAKKASKARPFLGEKQRNPTSGRVLRWVYTV